MVRVVADETITGRECASPSEKDRQKVARCFRPLAFCYESVEMVFVETIKESLGCREIRLICWN